MDGPHLLGHVGEVTRKHGSFSLPDVEVHSPRGVREAVYAVRFDAGEIWQDGQVGVGLNADLWDSFLEKSMTAGHHHHPVPPAPVERRAAALEELLIERGLINRGDIDALKQAYETQIGPMNGTRVVARAWIDPAYKKRLLASGRRAVAELGINGPEIEYLQVVENSPTVHKWLSALCAPAIRGECSACHPTGTRIRLIGRAEELLGALVTRDAMIGVQRL